MSPLLGLAQKRKEFVDFVGSDKLLELGTDCLLLYAFDYSLDLQLAQVDLLVDEHPVNEHDGELLGVHRVLLREALQPELTSVGVY